jgi:hypothetical protein
MAALAAAVALAVVVGSESVIAVQANANLALKLRNVELANPRTGAANLIPMLIRSCIGFVVHPPECPRKSPG